MNADSNLTSRENKKNDSIVTVKISKDALDKEVKYKAQDSIVYDAKNKIFLLYNKVQVNYDDIQLNAAEVTYWQDSNLMFAHPNENFAESAVSNDSSQQSFKQADQLIIFNDLKYNFKSQRALVHEAHTQYGEGYVIGQTIKRNSDQSINSSNSIYTTCSNKHPHFGIYSKKIKVVPNNVAVAGRSNLVIEDIPTPLVLPFAIYPLKKGQRAGFILPKYQIAQFNGLGLTDLGYYFPISNKLDAQLSADIYSQGSWRVGVRSGYANKYHYNGSLNLNYSFTKIGDEFEEDNIAQKNFRINWTHNVDSKARPGTSFSASVNFGSSGFNKLVYTNNVNTLTQNQFNSSINYSKTWVGKPFNLSINANHSQNTTTRDMTIALPTVQFNVNQFSPLQRKTMVGKTRWYEQINMSYNARLLNQITFKDSNLASAIIDASAYDNGMVQTIPINFSQKILKYVNFTTSFNYREYWYTRRRFKYFDQSINRLDTIDKFGFYAARDYDMSAGFNTRIFGTKLFKKGKLKGIRHELRPGVGFSYNPNFAAPQYNYYYQTFTGKDLIARTISYYEGSVVGVPRSGKNGSINFNVDNILQIKVKSQKDSNSSTKNVNILDGFSFSTRYNLAVDSFQLDPLIINYRSNILGKISLSGGAKFLPYHFDYDSKRYVNTFEYEKSGRILSFDNFFINMGGSYQSKSKASKNTQEKLKGKTDVFQNADDYIDFDVPFSINYTYNARLSNVHVLDRKKDSLTLDHSFILSGTVNLTPKWKIGFNTGYNFTIKELNVTSLDIYRDLHCWEMTMSTYLNGFQKGYVFTLRPKAGTLQDLRLNRRKDFRDNF